jgi:hypothetical protein
MIVFCDPPAATRDPANAPIYVFEFEVPPNCANPAYAPIAVFPLIVAGSVFSALNPTAVFELPNVAGALGGIFMAASAPSPTEVIIRPEFVKPVIGAIQ